MEGSLWSEVDSSTLFADVIAATTLDDLDAASLEAAKKAFLDTIGVMWAATGESPALDRAAELAMSMGGNPEATLLGRSEKVMPLMAAFANGALVHYLDFDDIEYDSIYHPSGSIVPALLALADGRREIGGRELIEALALGQDLGIRMARAIPLQRRPAWHRTVVIGTFAAAAASARLLGLDKEGIADALGHALNHAAGSLELRWGADSEIGGMYVAYSAKAGVFSALMAKAGIAGVGKAFDGEAGFFQLYFDGRCNRNKLLSGLGEVFTSADVAIKPWPACAANNTYVAATLGAMEEHGFGPDHIERIELLVGDYARRNCEPLAARCRPNTAPDAKFSLPYCVAAATVRRNLRIADFSDASRSDVAILSLTERTTMTIDSAYDAGESMPPGAVRFFLKDGRTIFRKQDLPLGHPSNPLSWEQLSRKAFDCFAHGSASMRKDQAGRLVEMCRELESVRDLSPLYQALAGQ